MTKQQTQTPIDSQTQHWIKQEVYYAAKFQVGMDGMAVRQTGEGKYVVEVDDLRFSVVHTHNGRCAANGVYPIFRARRLPVRRQR